MHPYALPTHPRTGLRAVGIVAGRPVWPVRGADSRGDDLLDDPRVAALSDNDRRGLAPYLTRAATLGEDFDRASAEVDAITEQYGDDVDKMPAGQAQRYENTRKRLRRLADEVTEADEAVEHRIATVTRAYEALRNGGPGAVERIGAPDVLVRSHRNPWSGLAAGLEGDSPAGMRARAMDMAEFIPDVPQAARKRFAETVEKDTDPRSALSRWALAAGRDEYRSAFFKMMQDPQKGHMLWNESERAAWADVEAVSRAVEVGTDAAGGYMVPYFLDPSVIISNAGAAGGIRKLVRNVTTAGNAWHGVSSAGVVTEWLAESAEAADASPTVDDPTVPLEKLSVFVPFSFEAESSVPLLAGELQRLIMDAHDLEMSRVIVAGTGVGQPTGVVTALAGSKIALGTVGVLAAGDVYGLQKALGPRYQSRAAFAANLGTINELAQIETTNGAKQFPGVEDDRLLRRALAEDSTLNTVGDATGASIAYGDFESGYVAATGVGTRIELARVLFGPNGRPTGQRGYFMWTRVGGNVVDPNAIKLLAA